MTAWNDVNWNDTYDNQSPSVWSDSCASNGDCWNVPGIMSMTQSAQQYKSVICWRHHHDVWFWFMQGEYYELEDRMDGQVIARKNLLIHQFSCQLVKLYCYEAFIILLLFYENSFHKIVRILYRYQWYSVPANPVQYIPVTCKSGSKV